MKTNKAPVICIIGLGYVGLPLAEAFSRTSKVIGFDVDKDRLENLRNSHDKNNPIFTDYPKDIGEANFIIICVPTPVTESKEPELSFIESAAKLAGRNMEKGSTIILESTVYPGVTEEIIMPILEKESGFHCGRDFKVAYSPERINPGDSEHSLDKVTKVVAGMDSETTELVVGLYSKIVPNVFRAKNIKTAEAAKVIENVQRDVNIALTNELALIFEKMGLNTRDVLETAATKWNFHRYTPGMVGGYCIPAVPYYLVYKSRELGYDPQVILAGRSINDSMPGHIATVIVKAIKNAGKVINNSRVLLFGLTYKGNVADTRESPAKKLIKELQKYEVEVVGFEPLQDAAKIEGEFHIKIYRDFQELKKIKGDAIIITIAHTSFRQLSLKDLKDIQNTQPIVMDIPGIFNTEESKKAGISYYTL